MRRSSLGGPLTQAVAHELARFATGCRVTKRLDELPGGRYAAQVTDLEESGFRRIAYQDPNGIHGDDPLSLPLWHLIDLASSFLRFLVSELTRRRRRASPLLGLLDAFLDPFAQPLGALPSGRLVLVHPAQPCTSCAMRTREPMPFAPAALLDWSGRPTPRLSTG